MGRQMCFVFFIDLHYFLFVYTMKGTFHYRRDEHRLYMTECVSVWRALKLRSATLSAETEAAPEPFISSS